VGNPQRRQASITQGRCHWQAAQISSKDSLVSPQQLHWRGNIVSKTRMAHPLKGNIVTNGQSQLKLKAHTDKEINMPLSKQLEKKLKPSIWI
jgi:hypothetical protein